MVNLAPSDLVDVAVRHNTELKVPDGGIVVPDVCLRFFSKSSIPNIAHPVVCQIAFSEALDDALDVIEGVVEGNPSVQMVLLLNIKESPPYSRPSPDTEAWNTFSKDQMLKSLPQFSAISSRVGKTDNVFTEPVIVANHVWCSIDHIDFYVWIRHPSTGVLDIRAATTDEYSAQCVSSLLYIWF